MISLKQFMELCEYRITEGSDYGWTCYGPNAYSLSSWNGDYQGWSMNIIFDTKNQAVYEADVCDYKNKRAYRMILPEFKALHDDEAKNHDVDANEAWDQAQYVDLEVNEDFVEKAQAIAAGLDYDTRVTIPLNMPDEVLMTLFKMAHEADITFNTLLENLLTEEINRLAENQPELETSAAKMKNKKSKKS